MEIGCIVIDDEPLAISKLENFISKVPELRLLHSFDNGIEAMSWLRENNADLIFLDIQMEQLTGMEFLEATHSGPAVIITSAYDEYALKGYELNVTDYLLKPFSFERFMKSVDKVIRLKVEKTDGHDEKRNSYLFVKTEYRYERIDVSEILYIEGMKDYLRIICTGKKIMTLQSFAKLEESLPARKFCRVHKSFMVALDKIRSVEKGVILIADKRIPVSATYREEFFRKIKVE